MVCDGTRRRYHVAWDGERLLLDTAGGSFDFVDVTYRAPGAAQEAGTGRILSPMEAVVAEVRVAVGDRVEEGQTLLVLAAMKLEHRVLADVDGVVSKLEASSGDQVGIRQFLAQIDSGEGAASLETNG